MQCKNTTKGVQTEAFPQNKDSKTMYSKMISKALRYITVKPLQSIQKASLFDCTTLQVRPQPQFQTVKV